MRILGVDPGSAHTGYGCVDASDRRYRVLASGTISPPARTTLPEKLLAVHDGLMALVRTHAPTVVAVENLFYARNVRSALTLGHVRGAVMVAAGAAGVPVAEYSPAEVKRAVVGYGQAEKHQVQAMVMLVLGLVAPPARFDVSDALAVAICHAHAVGPPGVAAATALPAGAHRLPRRWRDYRPPGVEP